MKAFRNATVYVYGAGLKRTDLVFGDRICAFADDNATETIPLPDGAIVLPGFIDEHIHGAGGCDAMDGTPSALATIAETVAAEGTTGFLATTMTQSPQNILNALTAVKEYRARRAESGAEVLGVHLEGPFIAAKYKGAQPLQYVARPSIRQFEEYNAASGNSIRIVTLAPEEAGAAELISYLYAHGITASIGHTGAGVESVRAAIAAGAQNVTHTYNAQSALHHREIGVVGSALLFDELNCELICDAVHVSVPAMQLLHKSKPQGKLTLITDAMRAKGLTDGVSELGGPKAASSAAGPWECPAIPDAWPPDGRRGRFR